MNIALGALIITILLLPGAFCLKAYYSSFSEKDKELHVPFAELLFRGLVFSFLIHLIAIGIIKWFGTDVDFKLLYQITIADKFQIKNHEFTTSFLEFGLYNLIINVLAYTITKQIKILILRRNLDIKYFGLRTSNFWFLIFSARYLDANKKGRRSSTDIIWVDIMVSEDMVYSGFLFDFEYSASKDELETLTLKNASKRTYIKLDENGGNGENQKQHRLKLDEPRSIQGDAFVILAKEIININLYYINLDETSQQQNVTLEQTQQS